MMCKVENVLREVRRLNDAPDLDSALILNQCADRMEELGRELAVPSILPCNQPYRGSHGFTRALVELKGLEDTSKRAGTESD